MQHSATMAEPTSHVGSMTKVKPVWTIVMANMIWWRTPNRNVVHRDTIPNRAVSQYNTADAVGMIPSITSCPVWTLVHIWNRA
jgi:hypothetical protein